MCINFLVTTFFFQFFIIFSGVRRKTVIKQIVQTNLINDSTHQFNQIQIHKMCTIQRYIHKNSLFDFTKQSNNRLLYQRKCPKNVLLGGENGIKKKTFIYGEKYILFFFRWFFCFFFGMVQSFSFQFCTLAISYALVFFFVCWVLVGRRTAPLMRVTSVCNACSRGTNKIHFPAKRPKHNENREIKCAAWTRKTDGAKNNH